MDWLHNIYLWLLTIPAWFGPFWMPVWTLIKIFAIILPLLGGVAYLTLAERKVIGYMQVRIGPNRVGYYGLLQPLADGIKLMFKEIVIPTGSNKFLFVIAPVLAFMPALAAWAVVPFSDNGYVLADVNAGLLYILAVTSLGVYGIIIAGWASNSKYARLGSLHSAAQIVSSEIAMGFAMVCVLMASQSMNMTEIVHGQQGKGGMFGWYFIPLFPVFVVYLIAGVADTNRAPFDLAEAESELVAGFHVEYSGMAFALFFLAEYANMILIATLTALMFLGGWLPPFNFAPFTWIPNNLWLLLKVSFVLLLFLWFRATFPRYRYDQLMRLGWKVFIPLTLVWVVVLGIWMQTPLWVW